jgi:hypothetical protein
MPRGYRCIIVALVGWLSLTAANPQQTGGKPTGAANQNIADALNNVATALQRPDEPDGYQAPCNEGEDKRYSDLCAQWKAADAARNSADYTLWFGILGSLLGALTLAAAAAAAWYARKAAIHTEESAFEARRAADVAEQELENTRHAARPYLQSDQEAVSWTEQKLMLHMLLRNVGTTPANGLLGKFDAYLGHRGKISFLRNLTWQNGTMGPGGSADLFLPLKLSGDQANALTDGAAKVYITLEAQYLNAFDEVWTYIHNLEIDASAVKHGRAITADCKQMRNEEGEPNQEAALDFGADK